MKKTVFSFITVAVVGLSHGEVQENENQKNITEALSSRPRLDGASLRKLFKDGEQSAKWYKEAVKENNTKALYQLGKLYMEGQGGEKDDVKAVLYLCVAAERGHIPAKVQLGEMYLAGRGVSYSSKEALRLFRFGAMKGNTVAQMKLGQLYLKGDDPVAVNLPKAYAWGMLAIRKMRGKGATFAGLNKMMTPEQLEEGEKLYQEYAKKCVAKK